MNAGRRASVLDLLNAGGNGTLERIRKLFLGLPDGRQVVLEGDFSGAVYPAPPR